MLNLFNLEAICFKLCFEPVESSLIRFLLYLFDLCRLELPDVAVDNEDDVDKKYNKQADNEGVSNLELQKTIFNEIGEQE
jgi:hypothetical protein